MKKAYIVHGWGGSTKELLHTLLAEKLSKNGFEVHALNMPNADEPNIDEWVAYLRKEVKDADENTCFIGHSIGCQAIMRYLETLDEHTRVGKCIFIAGWFNLENMESKKEEEISKPWIDNLINFSKIKKMPQKIIVFLSSNEFYGCIEKNSEIFREKLGAKIIMVENMGHFTNDEGKDKLSAFVGTIEVS